MSSIKIKESLQSPTFSLSHKLSRAIWGVVYLLFFKFSPVPFFAYRRWLLSLFGAKLASKTHVYPTVKIWLPNNLTMEPGSTLGPGVIVYNQGDVIIGSNSTVSQGVHLCASTHDYNDSLHPLLLAPINIRNDVWVCADAFIGPGVTVAAGSVIGARGVLMKDSELWSVYAGNPAKKVNDRKRFK
jgi:putative colanic acid biosynthesis acetyltransferase WcaF